MLKRNNRAFTLVELIIIVAIVGVLATIAVVGMAIYQAQARDAQRAANATSITEALEKYYLENGEYPSVNMLVNSNSANTASVVANRLKVNEDSLKMPQSTQNYSIAPIDTESDDVIIYDAQSTVNNDVCQTQTTNAGCDRYTLTYETENGDSIVINSRYDGSRTGTVAVAPSQPVISVGSGGGMNVRAELSEATCSENADRLVGKYTFQHRINGGAWSAWTSWGTTQQRTIAGAEGQTFEFRGQTRCDDGDIAGKPSLISEPDSYTIPAGAPDTPTVTVALSSGNVVATATAEECISGYTTQYAFRSRTNNGTWGAYGAWGTTRTSSRAPSQGVKYGYQVQARCYSTAATSPTSTSTEGVYTHPIATPGAPSVSSSTSGNTTTNAIGTVTCVSGTSPRYQYRFLTDAPSTGSWYGPYTTKPAPSRTTTNQGFVYTTQVQVQCYNSFATSSWSPVGQSSYERPVSNPSNTSFSGRRGDWRTIYLTGTTTCGSGAVIQMRADVYTYDWQWTPFPPNRYGWYRTHFGSWAADPLQSWGTTITTGSSSGSSQGIPSGTRWKIAVEKRCRNYTTGKQTGVFYQESGAYTF